MRELNFIPLWWTEQGYSLGPQVTLRVHLQVWGVKPSQRLYILTCLGVFSAVGYLKAGRGSLSLKHGIGSFS